MDTIRWTGLLRGVTYGIITTPAPMERVDTGFNIASVGGALGTPAEYLEAIGLGLASTEDLGRLIGLDHSDATVREYLRAVEARLRNRNEGGSRR